MNKLPLEVHREPSGKAWSASRTALRSILPQYDFGAQIRALTEDEVWYSPSV